MGARLSGELGIEPELIRGDRGIFDIAVDGKLIFSKHSTGQFPDEAEIIRTIRSLD